jgi:nucleoid-associated protein YgaU
MRKDLKIGTLIGLVLAAFGMIWLVTRPYLCTKARLLQADSTQPAQAQEQQFFTTEHSPVKPSAYAPSKSMTLVPSTPQQTRTSQSNPEPAVKIHIVEKGQTLSDIAYKYYGSTGKWRKIFEANRSSLKDANTLIPGMRLTIPE